jgi:hypothetical protein
VRRIEQRGVFAHHLALAPVGLDEESHVRIVHALRRGYAHDRFAARILADAELQVGGQLVRIHPDALESLGRCKAHDQPIGLVGTVERERNLGDKWLGELGLHLDRTQPNRMRLHRNQRAGHRKTKNCRFHRIRLHRKTLPENRQ